MLVGAVMQQRLGLHRLVILLFVTLTIGIVADLVVVSLGRPHALSARGEWNGIFQQKNMLGIGWLFSYFGACDDGTYRFPLGDVTSCFFAVVGAIPVVPMVRPPVYSLAVAAACSDVAS